MSDVTTKKTRGPAAKWRPSPDNSSVILSVNGRPDAVETFADLGQNTLEALVAAGYIAKRRAGNSRDDIISGAAFAVKKAGRVAGAQGTKAPRAPKPRYLTIKDRALIEATKREATQTHLDVGSVLTTAVSAGIEDRARKYVMEEQTQEWRNAQYSRADVKAAALIIRANSKKVDVAAVEPIAEAAD